MPDDLDELFAELRAATLPRVRPPGIDAARRTARRRRRTSRTVAVAAVALVVAGGLVITGHPLRGAPRTAPAERLKDLAGTGERALDTQLPEPADRPLSGDDSPGADGRTDQQLLPAPESSWNAARAGAVLEAGGRLSPTLVTTEQVLTTVDLTGPGDFAFVLVCAGPGTLTLTVRTAGTGDPESAGTTVVVRQVECHDAGPRLDPADLLTLPENAGLEITAVPDDAARNRAGWAYHLGPR